MHRVVLKYMAPLLRPCLKHACARAHTHTHTHTTKQVYVNMCPWMLCFQAIAHFKKKCQAGAASITTLQDSPPHMLNIMIFEGCWASPVCAKHKW